MSMVVTVGRNVGDSLDARPMATDTWRIFCGAVELEVTRAVGPAYFTGHGDGWSPEWGVEDAFTVVAPEPEDDDIREKLYARLAEVGRYYGQEAVAVTEGLTTFV
jgi:hypothetical protein